MKGPRPRVLDSHLFLGGLPDELAALAERGPEARAELEAVVRAEISRGLWPTDAIGRAALVAFLIDRPDLCSAVFRHGWQRRTAKPGRLTIDSTRRRA